MTELHDDHLSVGEHFEHVRYQQLREAGHRPEYRDVRVIPSESSDKAYLVATVSTLPEPFDPAETDESADRIDVRICACDHFNYRLSGGFEDGENPPEEWGTCKHIHSSP